MLNNLIFASVNYVPWDVSALSELASHIRKTVGTTVNIGLLIFAIILAILIAIRVVKKFSKG